MDAVYQKMNNLRSSLLTSDLKTRTVRQRMDTEMESDLVFANVSCRTLTVRSP